jgi:hypothetical protein
VATVAGSYKKRAMIIDNEVFEPIKYKDVLIEMKSKIFHLLIVLNVNVINIRKIMDGSRAKVGEDVFDTYALVIDYPTVLLLISLAFGNNWAQSFIGASQ